MSGDPHFRGATPESLARALLRPRRRKPSLAPESVPARAWEVGLDTVFEKGKTRLDTSLFDPKIDVHIESLTGTETQFLQEVAEVRLPGRFERVWAIDSEQGRPYLNATDLLTLFALGVPSQVRYLSPESETDFDGLVIPQKTGSCSLAPAQSDVSTMSPNVWTGGSLPTISFGSFPIPRTSLDFCSRGAEPRLPSLKFSAIPTADRSSTLRTPRSVLCWSRS